MSSSQIFRSNYVNANRSSPMNETADNSYFHSSDMPKHFGTEIFGKRRETIALSIAYYLLFDMRFAYSKQMLL